MKDLIIVESPAKARTIKNFLGDKFEVIASKGHIRDLPKYAFGIKVEDKHFYPEYKIDSDHKEIVSQIKNLAKKANNIYIATDEDREGEAIGFHITQAIDAKKNLKDYPRIVFHEITKTAINNALKNPRQIDMDKVNAQQARRLLDRIVGFKLSQLLSSKISKGLSAGRVQSAALKLIIDREREILDFKPQVYYEIFAKFEGIESELVSFNGLGFEGKKLKKLDITDEAKAKQMVLALQNSSFKVSQITRKNTKSQTPPPFMTSTLQQLASSLLGYSPSRTMSIAQKLYEGVPTNNGTTGIITYMRTDSLNIAKEAQDSARAKLFKDFGEDYVPKMPKIYTTKNKSAQEAHEAIRPTNLDFSPQIAKNYLKPDELKLYTLIYNRFLASQSQDAIFESQNVSFISDVGEFKASGRKLVFDGFYRILGNEDKDKLLPDFKENAPIKPQEIIANENSTEPPARYSEASLIKTLESLGIGRPSTYAPTISLLTNREYITIQKRQIQPQESAFNVISMLEAHFNEIVDSKFSANLEEKLDSIAEEKLEWQKVLWDFYEPFMGKIDKGKQNIASQKISIPTGEPCPKCGKDLVKRKSKYGEFVACSGYPKCKYIKQENIESSEVCEKCGKPMVKKVGKRGEFLACSGYPECKNAKSLGEKKPLKTIDVACPECGGEIVERFGRRGAFYGCSNYPKCTFVASILPTNKKCPNCGYIMGEKSLKAGDMLECLKCKQKLDANTLEPIVSKTKTKK